MKTIDYRGLIDRRLKDWKCVHVLQSKSVNEENDFYGFCDGPHDDCAVAWEDSLAASREAGRSHLNSSSEPLLPKVLHPPFCPGHPFCLGPCLGDLPSGDCCLGLWMEGIVV